ncbi:FHA domain-containing protein, partial [bacterium]|nr:FHA domain-containing protein [bacterium]
MPKIIITHKKNKEDQVHSLGIEEVLIGRSSLNGIELPSNGVSRNHAKILHLDGEYYLIDTSSGNGTILNG